MPCLCVKCHEPCNCDEILCTRCLMDTITASDIYEFEIDQLKERKKKID
jgi:hypothetical protein